MTWRNVPISMHLPAEPESIPVLQPTTLHVPAQASCATQVRARLRAYATDAGFSADDVAEIEVAVGEAVTNAILYGRPAAASGPSHIVMHLEMEKDRLVVEIRDLGPGFDVHSVRMTDTSDTDALGGRGLWLMRALMNQVDIHYSGKGMVVRLARDLPAPV